MGGTAFPCARRARVITGICLCRGQVLKPVRPAGAEIITGENL